MSVSSRIIVRLTITTAVAAAVSYGWLYVKQSRVEAYLRERTLVRQAQEISSYISTSRDGSVYLDLPSKLSEAYNNPGSRYRYAVRDEAGRVVATSGRRVGPLPNFLQAQDHPIYTYRAAEENSSMLGAAVRSNIGQKALFTQVEQTVPMTQSLNAAVFNEFSMDGGWLGIPFLLAVLGISAFTIRRSLAPLDELATLATKIDPGHSTLRLPAAGIPTEILSVGQLFQQRARST